MILISSRSTIITMSVFAIKATEVKNNNNLDNFG
jgi:hypothetical protein